MNFPLKNEFIQILIVFTSEILILRINNIFFLNKINSYITILLNFIYTY